jgi:23S rRNA pseudouridine955/2504/2580 synthase
MNQYKHLDFTKVNQIQITEHNVDQRIDNFINSIFATFKSLPKTHIHKIIRNGEVRINKKRIDSTYKLQLGDVLRLPPIRIDNNIYSDNDNNIKINQKINHKINIITIYEDDAILAIHKPAGMAVHGGSGVSYGVIEYLRSQDKYKDGFLELVHRLDKETSGVLLLAKKRKALVDIHEQIRNGKCLKKYYAIVSGNFQNEKQNIRFPLKKIVMANGERKVFVDEEQGQECHTIVYLHKSIQLAGHVSTWLDIELKTGRTHQIRVHLSHLGFPIIGDEKYGNFNLNKQLQQTQSAVASDFQYRMYLHAYFFGLMHPITGQYMEITADVDVTWK